MAFQYLNRDNLIQATPSMVTGHSKRLVNAITCKVCGKENEETSVVCVACRSYLQSKTDALNLFEMIWALIESPRQAFRRVVLATHKNYIFLLSSLLGIALAHTVFWYKNLGNDFSSLFTLVVTGFIAGPVFGILYVFVVGTVLRALTRVFGGYATLKNMFAVSAYATVPVVLALVLVWPIEIAVFGLFFFGNNPSPMVINPMLYLVLISLDAIAGIWSLVLLVIGTSVANGFGGKGTARVTLAVISIMAMSWLILHVA